MERLWQIASVSWHHSVAETMVLGLGGRSCTLFSSCQKLCWVRRLQSDVTCDQEVLFAQEPQPHEPETGWQQKATKRLHEKFQECATGPDLGTLRIH